MTHRRPHCILLALAALSLIAIAIGSLLPVLPDPLQRATLAIGNQHLIAYLVAAYLLGLGLEAGLRGTVVVIAALACYGGAIELLQALVPGRAGAMEDFWMNTAGATLGGAAAWFTLLGRRVWLRAGP